MADAETLIHTFVPPRLDVLFVSTKPVLVSLHWLPVQVRLDFKVLLIT